MIIYYRKPSDSPNMRKVSIMLAETGLPFTPHFVEPTNKDTGLLDPEYAMINPNGTAPAITDTDTGATLFESGAILYYLAGKAGMLLPESLADRAEAVKWLMFEAANVSTALLELHHYILNDTGEFPDTIFRRYRDKVTRHCSVLEQQLEKRPYLCGDYSIADIALYPWTVTLEDLAEIDLNDFPRLKQWAEGISARPAAQ